MRSINRALNRAMDSLYTANEIHSGAPGFSTQFALRIASMVTHQTSVYSTYYVGLNSFANDLEFLFE